MQNWKSRIFSWMSQHQRKAVFVCVVAVAAIAMQAAHVIPVHAAALTNLADYMSTLKASTVANHEIYFVTPTGVESSSDTIAITFGAGFNMGSVAFGDVDLDVTTSTNECSDASYGTAKTLAATVGVDEWALIPNGQVLALVAPTNATTGEIAAGVCVRVLIGTNASGGSNQITNSTAGNITITFGGVFGDSGTIAINIIADDSVTITGTVSSSITFTISDNTIGFGTLSASAATWATGDTNGSASDVAAHTMTIATNATSGYAIQYYGATLTSGSNTVTVASITDDADGTQGSEAFGLGFSTDGNATIATGYDHNATPTSRDWAFTASTATDAVNESVPTATETISAFYLANIATTTEAGSYTTVLTYTATANF
ncbi:MAG: hypothetical protein ABIG71_00875 [Candidatus Uhrbacteria bacterium]